MHEAIEVRALRKRFGEVTALDGFDLDIEAGTVFGLLGLWRHGRRTAAPQPSAPGSIDSA